MRGYFGIGVSHPKAEVNFGTLLRSAHAFGAAFAFTIGRRFRKQASDVWSSWRHLPVYEYADLNDLRDHLPYGCPIVGIELDERAQSLVTFVHPERACYVLGAEDHGLSPKERTRCHALVQIPGASACLNVASAGTVVLYDRTSKAGSNTMAAEA